MPLMDVNTIQENPDGMSMAHWLKHCKVNEPIYIFCCHLGGVKRQMLPTLYCRWELFNTEECVRSTAVDEHI